MFGMTFEYSTPLALVLLDAAIGLDHPIGTIPTDIEIRYLLRHPNHPARRQLHVAHS